MTLLLMTLALSCMACCGLQLATQEGAFGFFFRQWAQNRKDRGFLHPYVCDMLVLCETCVATFWGQIIYWTAWLLLGDLVWWKWLILAPMFWLANAFGNCLLWSSLQRNLRFLQPPLDADPGRTESFDHRSMPGPLAQ